MIKTHMPRGYFWTHASAFQQTEEFRNLSYEEFAAPTIKALTPDPDETLSGGARQRKRRRIEKLADDFLNGEPLFISSARPCPEALKSTIKWNQKSSTEPKFEFEESTGLTRSTLLWEDVDDASDSLCGHYTPLDLSQIRDDVEYSNRSSEPAIEDAREPVPVQVSRASRRFRPAYMRSGPSSDALRKAAALRARKAHTLESEANDPKARLDWNRRLRSEDKGAAPKNGSTNWLSRGEPAPAPRNTNGNEDSLDELRLSNVETPSNPPNKSRASTLPQSVAQTAAHRRENSNEDMDNSYDSESIVITPRISETTNVQLDDSHGSGGPSARRTRNECIESNSYHTAYEEPEFHDRDEDEEEDGESQNDDSQIRLLKSQGFKGASPTAWRAVNTRQPQQATPFMNTDTISEESESRVSLNAVRSEPQSARRSARLNSTSQSETPAQRRPPARSHKQAVYKTEAASTTNGASPFKWRRKVTFPSSDEIIVEPRQRTGKGPHNKDMPRSAPVTPAATAPQRSSDREAAQVDVAHSSPVLTSHTPAPNAAGVTMLQQSLPETWIGTQAMLVQAQRDLLTSPEKAEHTPAAARVEEKPQQKSTSQRSDREPLKQLSQEPMPSTQAMMGDFIGFSTVKKPWRGGPRESIDSPSVLLRAKDTRHKATDFESPNLTKEYPGGTKSRPSGLRYSLESVESPLHSTNVDKPPSPQSPVIQRGADWSSTEVATSSKKASWNNDAAKSFAAEEAHVNMSGEASSRDKSQSLSFSSATGLPIFQAAQARSSLSQPNEKAENLDLDETIEDLTRYLLDTTDMEGVLSQGR